MVEEDITFTTFDGDTITKSEYRDELKRQYEQANYEGLTKITDFTKGSEAYHLVDLLAGLKLEFREEIDNNYRMSMIHTCEGEFLDNIGDMNGVHRIGSSPSVGDVVFTRKSGVTGDISIPLDTVVATDDAISFILNTDSEPVILSNQDICTVEVLCEQDGSFTNVEANTITLVMSEIAEKVTVNNSVAFTGGEDIEDDDTYRNRILEAPYTEPVASLSWYKRCSEELDTVHDVYVRKGTIQSEKDIIITFNPVNWSRTIDDSEYDEYNETNSIESVATHTLLTARRDLVDLFNLDEYNIAGISVGYHLGEKVDVLKSTSSETYLFSVLLKTGYVLTDLKSNIIAQIKEFNKGAIIGTEFNPNSLAVLIENEVEGVSDCRIVKRTGTSPNYSYEEVTSTTSMSNVQLFNIYYTNDTDLNDRIVSLNFNITIEEDSE